MKINCELNQSQMYLLIISFEKDARQLILDFFEDRLESNQLYEHYLPKILNRKRNEGNKEISNVTFLDLGDLIDLLFANKSLLPSEIENDLNGLKSSVGSLIAIRNKIMHGRPIRDDDDITLKIIINNLSSQLWVETYSQIELINSGREKNILDITYEPEDSVLNNLPRAEHGETGLIGRQRDLDKIINWLTEDRLTVITITGAGGLGKTALAMQVAYNLVDSIDKPFEAVFWVSLKTERLTIEGIESITDAITDLDSATNHIGSFIDKTFSGAVEDLASVLADSKVLICIDNMETATASAFMSLYDKLPNAKFLLTSRTGIGQVERRYDLQPLDDKDAVHYLNVLIRKLNVDNLAKISEKARFDIVQSRSNNPLLIKWFVLGIKAGKTLPELRSTNHDAVKFCVEAVILALTPPSRNVLISLYVLKKPTLLEELLTICEVSIDELSLSLQELSKSALIKTKYLGDALRAEYILAEMPEIYLNQSAHYMEQEISAANIKAQKLIEDEEKRQLDIRKSKFSPFSISIRDDGDKAVAALLRTALRKQRIAPQSALGLIEEAKHALPGYWENYKTEAYVRSFLNQTSEVEKLLNIALDLAPDNISKSVCSYRLSQFYIDNNDLEKSLIFANLSVEYEKDSYNLQLLGWVLIRNMSFESGIEILQSGLDSADASSVLIAKTKLISGYRRWGDNILERERNPTRAMAQFAKARDLIFGEVMAGTYEEKLLEEYVKLIFSITNVFRSIYTNSGTISHEEDLTLSEYLTFADRTTILNRYKDQVQNSLRILSGVGQKTSEVIGNLTFNFPSKNLVGSTKSIEVFEGQILSINNGRYGFIANPNFPHNIFFAGSVLIAGTKMDQLLPGVLVHFEIDYGRFVEADRVKASAVWVK